MADESHVQIAKQGGAAINEWVARNPDTWLDLSDAQLDGLDLAGANLRDVNLSGANLRNADLTGANMIAASLINTDLSEASLVAARLSHAKLTECKFRGADLTGANFVAATLLFTTFYTAKLTAAKFREVSMLHVDLRYTVLSDANFKSAQIAFSNFRDSTLVNTSFDECNFSGNSFDSVDLSSVTDLDSVTHVGPSSVGVDTLYLSKGRIPAAFLRGCGVPDGLIEYMPSLLGMQEAVEFYSCFISYSHADEEFCKRLYSRMRDDHLRVWYAPEDMKSGIEMHEQIDRAIRVHDKLLLVLSETSMQSSWVRTEIHKARAREQREGKRVLFPIRLLPFERIRGWQAFDSDTGTDVARELRAYFIPDFSDWKNHDRFEASYRRLLSDLKAEKPRE
jgi:uncharacterized protein YjbI with pentapeptide repeats